METIKELTKPLDPEDITLKIETVSEGKGFSLVPYKTARADVKRLNEVFGTNWENKFKVDENGHIVCTIGVYIKGAGMYREDVGFQDAYNDKAKEKGSYIKGTYSDAFKRAGFKWGIGTELYDFPFIWINWDNWTSNGKPQGAYTHNWKLEYNKESFKDGFKIIDDNGREVYHSQKQSTKSKKTSKPKQQKSAEPEQKTTSKPPEPPKNVDSFDRNWEIPFGKHKGTPLKEVPDGYLQWMADPEGKNEYWKQENSDIAQAELAFRSHREALQKYDKSVMDKVINKFGDLNEIQDVETLADAVMYAQSIFDKQKQ